MNINATLLGQVTILFAVLVAFCCYYLSKRTTGHPGLNATIGFLLSMIPPLGLIYLALLTTQYSKKHCRDFSR